MQPVQLIPIIYFNDSFLLVHNNGKKNHTTINTYHIKTLKQISYLYSRYETADGVVITELGALKRRSDDKGNVFVKKGSYSYTAPDGTPVHVEYTADENGFRPVSSNIPVPETVS